MFIVKTYIYMYLQLWLMWENADGFCSNLAICYENVPLIIHEKINIKFPEFNKKKLIMTLTLTRFQWCRCQLKVLHQSYPYAKYETCSMFGFKKLYAMLKFNFFLIMTLTLTRFQWCRRSLKALHPSYLYAKYEASSMYGSKVIANVKVSWI